MNCQRFENVVSELARGQMMAAEQRGEALAHSETCERCGARLRDEEMLTRGLQSLAAEMETLGASAGVESKLLEAFRNRRVVTPIARRRSNYRYWAAAIAAMLLIAISVVVFRWSNGVDEPRQAVQQPAPQVTPENKAPENKPADQVAGVQEQEDPLPQRTKQKRIRNSSVRRSESAQLANHVNKEIATDFIPLSYMSAASLQDGGQIIRVQLPRAALANFGLPVNMDRYNERVKADVLFGVDGRAQAIRFVQ
ncbi:MAG TPA: hypothetical protein VF435_18040 [Pyrinomonadaceae bacterium]